MTTIKKDTTLIQSIANSKGWTFTELAKRWEVSPRQLSRIATANKQRDIDAATGLPDKVSDTEGSTMNTFIISETQNLASSREGYRFKGTLTQAKRHASRNQAFHGTMLKIEREDGTLIASKSDNKWKDQ